MDKCKYCELSIRANKQGIWGKACTGCKSSLTKKLRSKKYTKAQLLSSKYDWNKSKWIIN